MYDQVGRGRGLEHTLGCPSGERDLHSGFGVGLWALTAVWERQDRGNHVASMWPTPTRTDWGRKWKSGPVAVNVPTWVCIPTCNLQVLNAQIRAFIVRSVLLLFGPHNECSNKSQGRA